MWNGLNLSQSGLELIASEAELRQVDAEVPKTVVVCFGRELIHRRYGLSNYRVMLDTVNDPRKQVDSPMEPHHLGMPYGTWIRLRRRHARHGECTEWRSSAFTNRGGSVQRHGEDLNRQNG